MTEDEVFKEVEMHCPACRGSIITKSQMLPPTMPAFAESGIVTFLTPRLAICQTCGFIAGFDMEKLTTLAEKRRERRRSLPPSEFCPRRSG